MKNVRLIVLSAVLAVLLACAVGAGAAPTPLFPGGLPVRQWAQFNADGFSKPVSGILFGTGNDTCCGVPLGGLGTGCLDLDTNGVFGFCSVFWPAVMVDPTPYHTLRNPKMFAPFLGISVGGKTWVLADKQFIDGGEVSGCIDPVAPGKYLENKNYTSYWKVNVPNIPDVTPARKITYFGHYPVADIKYTTDAPVSVALRAWAPFIPGDTEASNIPGAVFEVRLTNTTDKPQKGAVAFNFPGPVPAEANNTLNFSRRETSEENLQAVTVTGNRCIYTVGVMGSRKVAFGGNLVADTPAWAAIDQSLPKAMKSDPGASASVKFFLPPNQSQTVRFVLSWYVTYWLAGTYNEMKHFDETWTKNEYTLSKANRYSRDTYYPMYTTRYKSSLDAARELATKHRTLLRRILSWQQAVYTSKELPVWLRDSLVNSLALIAEDSLWATPDSAGGKIKSWASPIGGFQLVECPRTCAIVGCIASNWYGNAPITYFFPQLDRQILRDYQAATRPDGAMAFLFPANDLTKAAYEWQVGLNGACFAELVHRLWLRTGDKKIVDEFYPTVKKNMIFSVELNKGENGIICYPREGTGQSWWEHTPLFGMVSHLAGVRMAHLKMAQSMAKAEGDAEFADQCRKWIDQASQLTESQLWDEKTQSYLQYFDFKKNVRQDDIMSSQLDGEWMVNFNGLPGVFRQDRVQAVLKTIRKECLIDVGVVAFSVPGKGPDLTRYGNFPNESNIVGMTYMYNGDPKLGLEICRRNMDNQIRRQGYPWDLTPMIRCDTGERTFGCDYYQDMIIWDLPAAMQGKDISAPAKPGGLVDRILKAAK